MKAEIRKYLWGRDDLLKDPNDLYPLGHPLAGHCYVASEAYYHLTGGGDRWQVERCEVPVKEPGPVGGTARFTHWYLRERETGEVVDLTAEQFTEYEHDDVEIPYDKGTATGFLTGEPSKRAQRTIDAVTGNTSDPGFATGD